MSIVHKGKAAVTQVITSNTLKGRAKDPLKKTKASLHLDLDRELDVDLDLKDLDVDLDLDLKLPEPFCESHLPHRTGGVNTKSYRKEGPGQTLVGLPGLSLPLV